MRDGLGAIRGVGIRDTVPRFVRRRVTTTRNEGARNRNDRAGIGRTFAEAV